MTAAQSESYRRLLARLEAARPLLARLGFAPAAVSSDG
jgi:hypothetical protein